MTCYNPLLAHQCSDGEIVFDETRKHDTVRQLTLPCGQCFGCRLERSRQWAVRCMHEKRLHNHNCFITLTYNDENLPKNNSLEYRDFQIFMKKLRQSVQRESKMLGRVGNGNSMSIKYATSLTADMKPNVRFYMAGEYGEVYGRPHFHACLFNLDFMDKKYWATSQTSGCKLYRSEQLEKIWTKGNSTIGELTFESAAYAARYIMKKLTGDGNKTHYEIIDIETGEINLQEKEMNNMSRKPGIANEWLKRYAADVYPKGKVITRGHEANAPRYYDGLYKIKDPDGYETLKAYREIETLLHHSDNTPARLAVREKVARAKATQLKRSID